MELNEFLRLLKNNLGIFLVVLLFFVLGGLVFYQYQARFYIGTIAVNISREGKNENRDYQYDQFYRLQADEKFGQNIVNWVSDRGFLEDNRKDFNQKKSGEWQAISKIKAIQLSSNYIKITFQAKDSQSADVFGEILKENLKKQNKKINFNKSQNWFKLVIDKACVNQKDLNIYFVFALASALGIFFGILTVLLIDYFNYYKNENRN